MNNPLNPSARYQGAPTLNPSVPAARPARVVEGKAKATHQTAARITIRPRPGRLPRVELNREAMRALDLADGYGCELIPPRPGVSDQWYIDTRPPATGRLKVSDDGYIYFTTAAHIDPRTYGPNRAPRLLAFGVGPALLDGVTTLLPEG
jgi:hypothetical protein